MLLLYLDEPDKVSCSHRNNSEGSDKIPHRLSRRGCSQCQRQTCRMPLLAAVLLPTCVWMKNSQPGSHHGTSPPFSCFASCFVYGKAYCLVFEFLSIMSTLGKSDYRDNLLNSEEFQFVSIEFCQFRIPDTFVFQSIDWSLPARRSGICFHGLRN